jgi:exonuclease VII large subunit
MTRRLLTVMLAGASLVAGAQAFAHHSFAATYFEGQKITIEGEVALFQYRNPHSFLYVMVKDEQGKAQRWAIEWGGSGQLRNQNVAIDTVKPGDRVVVTGDPSRTPGEFRLRMRTINRPSDGWKWGDDID